MAFTAILRKSASSLAPLAGRVARVSRNHHSAIFTASSHLPGKQTSTSFVPKFQFSSAAKTEKPSSDESLLQVIDSEIKCAVEADDQNRVEATPSEFPFKIEDIPGQQNLILTGEYQGELIKIEVDMPDLVTGDQHEDDDDDDDDMEKPNQPRIPMVVTVTKNQGASLEFRCLGYPDKISIHGLSVTKSENSEDQMFYGPDFLELDKNLQKAFHRYLEMRGIKPATTSFLFEYMLNKDSREYCLWLEKLKNFLQA